MKFVLRIFSLLIESGVHAIAADVEPTSPEAPCDNNPIL